MTTREKIELVDTLSSSLNRVCLLRMIAAENNLPDEAERLDLLKDALKERIDELLKNLFAEWAKSSGKLAKKIIRENAALEKSLAGIEKTVRVSEKIVKASACLDTIVKTAAAIMK